MILMLRSKSCWSGSRSWKTPPSAGLSRFYATKRGYDTFSDVYGGCRRLAKAGLCHEACQHRRDQLRRLDGALADQLGARRWHRRCAGYGISIDSPLQTHARCLQVRRRHREVDDADTDIELHDEEAEREGCRGKQPAVPRTDAGWIKLMIMSDEGRGAAGGATPRRRSGEQSARLLPELLIEGRGRQRPCQRR